VYAKDLDRHDWPIFRSGYVSYTETWPTDDIGITNILVPVDPFLKTKVLSAYVLVDMYIGGEYLFLVVWRYKHLAYQQFLRALIAGFEAYIMSGKGRSVVNQ
jgi:hypothetical protein